LHTFLGSSGLWVPVLQIGSACANKVGDLIVATRNIADFTTCPVRCINPFVAKA